MITIKKYEEAFKSYLIEDNGIVFQHNSVDHSLAFTSVFFSNAKDLIMLSDGFKNDITSNLYYINNFLSFLDKSNSKLKIAIQSIDNWYAEPFLSIRKMSAKYPNRFEIFYIPNNIINNIKSKFNYFPDIMIDHNMFRLEDTPNHYFGSFNDKEECDKLSPFINHIFDNSKKIDLKKDINNILRKEKLIKLNKISKII